MEQRKPGRPRAGEEDRRDHVVSARLTAAERTAIEELAAAEGISPSVYVRRRLLGMAPAVPRKVQLVRPAPKETTAAVDAGPQLRTFDRSPREARE